MLFDCEGDLPYLGSGCFQSRLKGIFRAVRIFFTSTHQASFIREDVRLLQKSHQVTTLLTLGITSLFRIATGVSRSDLTYTWFASVYSAAVVFFARMLGKPCIVVVGGVDAARETEIGYGIWVSRWKSRFVRYAVVNADKVIAITGFLRDQLKDLASYSGDNIEVLPTGYDPSFWTNGNAEKALSVLTVAAFEDTARMQVKGIPLLLDTARLLPHVHFVVIGPAGKGMDLIMSLIPPENVTVIPFVPRDSLLDHYRTTKVYCQPSVFEGLPNSLCEAMLCECIPVATTAGGIPEAVGDTGFLIERRNPEDLSNAIRKALSASQELGRRARARIISQYPQSQREVALLNVVSELVH